MSTYCVSFLSFFVLIFLLAYVLLVKLKRPYATKNVIVLKSIGKIIFKNTPCPFFPVCVANGLYFSLKKTFCVA